MNTELFKFKVVTVYPYIRGGFKLYCYKGPDENGFFEDVAPVKLKKIKDNGFETEPFLTVPKESLQTLMDELWENGFRPSKVLETDKADIINHLEDMRRIAFHKLEMPSIEKGRTGPTGV